MFEALSEHRGEVLASFLGEKKKKMERKKKYDSQMINYVFLVPGEPEAKHTAHVASKRGTMDQPPKVNGSWERCQRHTRSVERGGNGEGYQ